MGEVEKMGQSKHRTKGGISSHAEKRLYGQYNCKIDVCTARRMLRIVKEGERNNFVWVPMPIQKKLMVKVPDGNRLVCVVADGEIVTIEDKPFNSA